MKSVPRIGGRVSLQNIADSLGLSKGAVSRALSDSSNISAATKRKVRAAAEKMGYAKSAVVSSVMSGMRSAARGQNFETVVLVNACANKADVEKYMVFAKYRDGILREAECLGYSVYEVWLHERGLDCAKLERILKSRGIRGGMLIGHFESGALPARFAPLWKSFKFISVGLRTSEPYLDFVCTDKFLIACYAAREALALGYKRPALVLDANVDAAVDGRFVGGFLRAQLDIPEADRIPPFLDVRALEKNSRPFFDWIEKYRPDAVVSVSGSTTEIFDRAKIRMPSGVELLSFAQGASGGHSWEELEKNYEMVGRVAVKRLSDMLNRPSYFEDISEQTATLITPRAPKFAAQKPRRRAPRIK